ncbi:MAG: flagellar basal body L-ring protein FlgH [Planctomycetes bacterium]|nr:flagellar basal body L-ring protein FlgH [Planctomycetota bacterium]
MINQNQTRVLLAVLLAFLPGVGTTSAQDGSLFLQPLQSKEGMTLANSSFIYRQLPPEARPRELQLHDIITVLVDFRSNFLSEADAENRKTATLQAVLADWLQIEGGSLKPAVQADGDPKVTGTLNSQTRVQSNVELNDSLTFRIAAEIVDIRPNGNLVIEGHLTIRNNEERWRISLTGEVRREAIQADRTVSSDSVLGLDIDKNELGQVRDGYARGWLGRFYDRYKPF